MFSWNYFKNKIYKKKIYKSIELHFQQLMFIAYNVYQFFREALNIVYKIYTHHVMKLKKIKFLNKFQDLKGTSRNYSS